MEVEDDICASPAAWIREYPKPWNAIRVDLGGSRIEGLMQCVDEVGEGFAVPEIADRSLPCCLTQLVDLAHCHTGRGHTGRALSLGSTGGEKNTEYKGRKSACERFHVVSVEKAAMRFVPR
jgi:hypothetical protein